jgi:choline-phosphate cytidylyltransferase
MTHTYADVRSTYADARSPSLRVYADARSPSLRVYADARSPSLRVYADARSPSLRVYADGVFDLVHFGHMRLFECIKTKLFPGSRVTLIVGIHSDEDVEAHKGPPLMKYAERAGALPHIRWIDEVVERAPWKIEAEFLAEHAIDLVAHDGDPYPAAGGSDLYEVPRALGIFRAAPRTPGISTTDIIQRVLDDPDKYVERNRSRGSVGSLCSLGSLGE